MKTAAHPNYQHSEAFVKSSKLQEAKLLSNPASYYMWKASKTQEHLLQLLSAWHALFLCMSGRLLIVPNLLYWNTYVVKIAPAKASFFVPWPLTYLTAERVHRFQEI